MTVKSLFLCLLLVITLTMIAMKTRSSRGDSFAANRPVREFESNDDYAPVDAVVLPLTDLHLKNGIALEKSLANIACSIENQKEIRAMEQGAIRWNREIFLLKYNPNETTNVAEDPKKEKCEITESAHSS